MLIPMLTQLHKRHPNQFHFSQKIFHLIGAASLVVLVSHSAWAGPREAAARLYSRIASQNPTKEQLDDLQADITSGHWDSAARKAMASDNFYNTTLKNWTTPMSNRDGAITRPLNDMTATLIGIIRDEDKENSVPFDEILSGDILYVPGPAAITAGIPAYRRDSNDNYRDMETKHLNLADPTVLQKATQSATYAGGVNNKAIAGVVSTRQWASEYFSAGTNRRSFRFAAINYLCRDYEQMFDTSIPDVYVTRDVDRAPGGDAQLYLRRCIGCHAGFNDPFRKAVAYYDFGNLGTNMGDGLLYKQGNVNQNTGVPNKINDGNRQAVFTDYKNATVVDDSWVNLITVGVNKNLGWNAPRSGGSQLAGSGAQSLGRAITATDAFAQCIVHRAFQQVCIRKPTTDEETQLNTTIAKQFQTGSDGKGTDQFKVKPVFSKVSELCLKE